MCLVCTVGGRSCRPGGSEPRVRTGVPTMILAYTGWLRPTRAAPETWPPTMCRFVSDDFRHLSDQ